MSRYIGHFDGQTFNEKSSGEPVYAVDWLQHEAVVNEGIYYVADIAEPERSQLLRSARVLPGT